MTEETVTGETEKGENSATPVPPQSTPGLAEIASQLAGGMPEVQQHAIDKAQADATTSSEQAEKFDPAIHATDTDGNPKYRADGSFALKRGRKAGATQSKINKPERPPQITDSEVAARQSGKVCAALCIQLGVVVGGDEWLPRKDASIGMDEQLQIEAAFANYFNAKGYTDIPPGLALVLSLAAYALPRFTMPKTRTRLARAKDWIVSKWVQFRARKAGANVRVEPNGS